MRRTLEGRVIGFSVSPPPDLIRRGYPLREFDRICFELAMRVILAEGRLLYGGHLHQGSMTIKLFEHVAAAYAGASSEQRPFLHFLSWSELGKTPFDSLATNLLSFRRFVETRVIAPSNEAFRLTIRSEREPAGRSRTMLELRAEADGNAVELVDQAALSGFHNERATTEEEALTAMRKAQQRVANARIALGGRRGDLGAGDRYGGEMPGICEEILATIQTGVPLVILAAFGGAARDAAIQLDLLEKRDMTPFLGDKQEGVGEAWVRLADARHRLVGDRTHLSEFAQRDDAEKLARDVVQWIADALPGPALAAALGPVPLGA